MVYGNDIASLPWNVKPISGFESFLSYQSGDIMSEPLIIGLYD